VKHRITAEALTSCTGCSACAAACRAGALTMQLNAEGFYEPRLVPQKCLDCGTCLAVCPIGTSGGRERLASYCGYHRDPGILYQSTSGGAFRALADPILDAGGLVFGAVYTEDFRTVLIADSDSTDIVQMQKSKYIVSFPQTSFPRIRQQLENGRTVLFSGAPCQTAGLLSYLGRAYPNLYTVDFICGGMPSLRFWQEHVTFLEQKYGAALVGVDFRSKEKGWGKEYLALHFANGKKLLMREYLDSYYHCFANTRVSVRSVCLDCPYRTRHDADITVGDFWGYADAGVTDVRGGMSLVTVNSSQGQALISGMTAFGLRTTAPQDSDYAFRDTLSTEQERRQRDAFFALAAQIGFEHAAKRLCPATVRAHIAAYLKEKLFRFFHQSGHKSVK